jgi:hypothetical protein
MLKSKHFWVMQDFQSTDDAPTSDTLTHSITSGFIPLSPSIPNNLQLYLF